MRAGLHTSKLKSIKVGRLWRVPSSDLDLFVEESALPPALVPADEAEKHA